VAGSCEHKDENSGVRLGISRLAERPLAPHAVRYKKQEIQRRLLLSSEYTLTKKLM
jgi:hypothetical protein